MLNSDGATIPIPRDAATVVVSAETKAKISAVAFILQRPEWDVVEDALGALLSDLEESDMSLVNDLTARIQKHTAPRRDEPEGTLADRIRRYVAERVIKPARENGDKTVDVVVRVVHRELGLKQRHPAVIAALEARPFSELCNVELVDSKGPKQSSTKILTFRLL